MFSPSDDLERKGHPKPMSLAQLSNPSKIVAEVGSPRPKEIEEYLSQFMTPACGKQPVYGTIRRVLKGHQGSYLNVNWVFTAINMKWKHFNRKDMVAVGEKGEELQLDQNLDYAIVFPRLAGIMAQLEIHDNILSERAYVVAQDELDVIGTTAIKPDQKKLVRIDYIRKMMLGYPVRKDKVIAVLNALNSHWGQALDLHRETCS